MKLYTQISDQLAGLTSDILSQIATDDRSLETHTLRLEQIPALSILEVKSPKDDDVNLNAPACIISWNIERGYHLNDIAEKIRTAGADVALLCEVDLGMARTEQYNVSQELADRLGMGYIYGVEFAELDLGDVREREVYKGQSNSLGFHGATILSKAPLLRPTLIRLETSAAWYDGGRGERRVGGRMALLATVMISGKPVTVATVHLESHSTVEERAEQMTTLLDGIEQYAPGVPVIIGGDFNPNTHARDRNDWYTFQMELERETPGRFANPVPFETFFDIAVERGYDWKNCNVEGTTTCLQPWHQQDKPLAKLDWFFTRGLQVTGPNIITAMNEAKNLPLSDHDMLSLTVDVYPQS